MIGRILGGYRILEQVGMGGMATVYKAFDPHTERFVAIKILPQQYSQDETFRTRFEIEAKAIAQLEHLHILPVFAYGEEDGITYMVMRYLDTGTLTTLIKRGSVPLSEASRLILQVASALDYAHSQGILHRDVKPSNILLDKQGNCYLTDFGIAKLLEGNLNLTGTSLVGTPQYMSPEQCRSAQDLTATSDQYSLGVVLYELVTGRTPYQAETPLAIIQKHILGDPLPPPRSLRPDLSAQAEAVILKALSPQATARYASCTALAHAFADALANAPTEEVVPDKTWREEKDSPTLLGRASPERTTLLTVKTAPHRPWLAGLLGLVVLLGGLAALWAAGLFSSEDPPPPATALVETTPFAQAVRTGGTIRRGPGERYGIIATLTANDEYNIMGISEDGAWYQLELADGQLGWVIASDTVIQAYGDLAAVAIAQAPPDTPSFTPTFTITPSATFTFTFTPTPTYTLTPTATATFTASPLPLSAAPSVAENSLLSQCGNDLCITTQGQEPQPLGLGAEFSFRGWGASWSPDGKRFVFAACRLSDKDRQCIGDLFIAWADGSQITPLADDPASSDISPSWSSDGEWIAWSANGQLKFIRPDGSETRAFPISGPDACPITSAWSPDNQQLAFMGCTDFKQLWVLDIASEDYHLLMQAGLYGNFVPYTLGWSPDGRRISIEQGNGDIYLIDANCAADGCDEADYQLVVERPLDWSPDYYPRWQTPLPSVRISGGGAWLYAEPRRGSETIGTPSGVTLPILSITADQTWVQVEFEDQLGWIHLVENVTTLQGDTSLLPIAPALPTFTPTITLTPTLTRTPRPLGKIAMPCGDNPVKVCIRDENGTNLASFTLDELPYWAFTQPSWSPDGTQLVLATCSLPNCPLIDAKLSVVNADGTGLHTFSLSENNLSPSWSPDGTLIAFHSSCSLAVIQPDGAGYQVLKSGAGICTNLIRWSPDSQWLAIISTPPPNQAILYSVWLISRDGSVQLELYSNPNNIGADLGWTADGKLIFPYQGRLVSCAIPCDEMTPYNQAIPLSWQPFFYPQWQGEDVPRP